MTNHTHARPKNNRTARNQRPAHRPRQEARHARGKAAEQQARREYDNSTPEQLMAQWAPE